MPYIDPISNTLVEPDGASNFQPRPIHGDASFVHLLSHQRQALAEHRQVEQYRGERLDDETAHLLRTSRRC